jgi:MFS family permease
MITKDQFKLLIPINMMHTMAHIFPYLLPILCLVIREEIPMNYTQTAVLSMIGILVTIPFTVAFGFLADKIHNYRLELIAGGYFLVFGHTFLIALANSYALLILAAVIGGIGASAFHPIALPMLSQEFGKDRNVAHSFNLIFGTLGSILTPIVSIALSGWLGWRKTSIIFGLFGLILAPLLLTFLFLGKKQISYDPKEFKELYYNHQVEKENSNNSTSKSALRLWAPVLTLSFFALVLAQVGRSGIFRIMNTFTSFIFEDKFGTSKLLSAGIMSIVLGMGGVSALISGFVSRKRGSLRIFLYSMISTTIVSILVAAFMGYLEVFKKEISITVMVLATLLFILLAMSFYFGSSSANALLAEMIPHNILTSVYGVVNASMTAFSSSMPVIFGAIVDKRFSFPYEYLLLIVLGIIPVLLLYYVKTQIGFKTPAEVEEERFGVPPCKDEGMGK